LIIPRRSLDDEFLAGTVAKTACTLCLSMLHSSSVVVELFE
jgi:hypothetical protein